MLDPRFPEDTLFLVAEQDFRFFEDDCVFQEDWLRLIAEAQAVDEEESRARRRLFELWELEEEGKGKAHGKAYGGWMPKAPKGKDVGTHLEFPELLGDLVDIVTQAKRIGLGGITWFAWCGSGKKKAQVSHGSHLLGISKDIVNELYTQILRADPEHFDVWLRNRLIDDRQTLKLKGSYVHRSCGAYDVHQSGCDPAIGDREAPWKASFVQEGVRPGRGQQDRWLCGFVQSKGANFIQVLRFGTEDLHWRTENPPVTQWWTHEEIWNMVKKRGWLDVRGFWIGPEKGEAKPVAGKGRGKKERGHSGSLQTTRRWSQGQRKS